MSDPTIPEDDTPEVEVDHDVPEDLTTLHEVLEFQAAATEQDGEGVVE